MVRILVIASVLLGIALLYAFSMSVAHSGTPAMILLVVTRVAYVIVGQRRRSEPPED